MPMPALIPVIADQIADGINSSFHFTPAGSEFTVTDLGGNTGGGTTAPWLAP